MNEKLSIHPSFYLFWIGCCLLDRGGYLRYFVLAALIHELGHAAAVALFRGEIVRIVFYAAGVCMVVRQNRGYGYDLLIAAAGPAAGLAAALAFAQLGWINLAGTNLLLSLFNCLPIFPLDGGCILAYAACLSPQGLRGYDAVQMASLCGAAVLTAAGVSVWCATGTNVTVFVIGLTLFVGNWNCSCKRQLNCL